MREVAVAQVLGAGEEIVHRAGDLPRQRQPEQQRHRLDDEEQDADHGQHRQRHAAHGAAQPRTERDALVDVDQVQRQVHAELAGAPAGPVGVRHQHDPAAQQLVDDARAVVHGRTRVEGAAARRHFRAIVGRQVVDAPELDAGFLLQAALDGGRDRQVEHDGPRRCARRRQRRRAGDDTHVALPGGGRRRGGGVVGHQVRVAVALDPRRQRVGRRQVCPLAGPRRQRHRRRARGVGRQQARRTLHALHRHERDRQERVPRGAGRLLPFERIAHGRRRRGTLHVEQDGLGEEARLLGLRLEPGAHHVARHVAHEQQPGQHEERQDEQARHETHEHVGQDQLAAYPPEQAPARPHHEPAQQVERHEHDRQGAGAAGERDERRGRVAGERRDERFEDLDQHAAEQEPPGQRDAQPSPGARGRRQRLSGQRGAGGAVGHQRGARTRPCAAQPIASRMISE